MERISTFFKLKENNTNFKTEWMAGLTTFMTMAYILAVNPGMLSTTGMDKGALFTATALASIVGTLAMALLANLPFALAPGMGLNAIFAFTICGALGASWETALAAVFIEGIIFILLTFLRVREAIIDAIPLPIKHAISVGIGLFIAFIGFNNAGIVKTGMSALPDGNLAGLIVALGDLTSPGALVALVGIVLTGALLAMRVKGAILFGILGSTILSIPLGLISFTGFSPVQLPPSIEPIFLKFSFENVFTTDMLLIMFTLLFVDMFDTVGTLIGVSDRAGMLNEQGQVPKAKQALLADAIATTVGACLGTSTVTTYVESAAGVTEGGRTGLTALSTAFFFALALFFSPVFLMVPAAATAPALIIVGMFMMAPVSKIHWEDFTEAIPAFLTFVMMPFSYSIADGITFGIVSYVFIKLASKRVKDIQPLTYILAALLILKYVIHAMQ